MGTRELDDLLNLSSWCLLMVQRLFLAVSQGCLRFVIVVFPDYTHLLFLCQFKMTGRSCTDEVRVKVPSFQKVTLFNVI